MTTLRLLLAVISILFAAACGGGTSSLPHTTVEGPAQSDATTVQKAVAAQQAAETPLVVRCCGLPPSPTYKSLYSFKGGPDGAIPLGGLIDVGGLLYGTTDSGGIGGVGGGGTVYAISMSGAEHPIHRFDIYQTTSNDGANPRAGVIDVNGALYGTTYDLGSGDQGAIFKVSTSGTESIIWSFGTCPEGGCGSSNPGDGSYPTAGLIDVNGVLYGTTSDGPLYSSLGTVFAVTPSGSTARQVYQFNGSPDGASPNAGLIDVNGTLYGTTSAGGVNCSANQFSGCGTVFEVSTSGSERVLYSFKGGADGVIPSALIDVNGLLYGTTYGGGANGNGTVFELTTSGRQRVLYSFKGGTDGASPAGGLIDVNGALYGTTAGGGASSSGTIFELSTSGTERVLYSFKGGTDGAGPSGSLLDVNGVLYGTTSSGGTSSSGTVFALTLDAPRRFQPEN